MTDFYVILHDLPKFIHFRALKQAPPSVTKKQVIDVELVGGENLPDVTHSYDGKIATLNQSIRKMFVLVDEKIFVLRQS